MLHLWISKFQQHCKCDTIISTLNFYSSSLIRPGQLCVVLTIVFEGQLWYHFHLLYLRIKILECPTFRNNEYGKLNLTACYHSSDHDKLEMFWFCIYSALLISRGNFSPQNSGMTAHGSTARATLIARLMVPTCGPSRADRTQMGPMWAPWTLLSGEVWGFFCFDCLPLVLCPNSQYMPRYIENR